MGGGGDGGNWSCTSGCSQEGKSVSEPMPVTEAEKEWLKAKMAWGNLQGTGFMIGVSFVGGVTIGAAALASGIIDSVTVMSTSFSLLVAAGLSWVAYRSKKRINAFFEATRPYGKKPEEKGAPAPKAG